MEKSENHRLSARYFPEYCGELVLRQRHYGTFRGCPNYPTAIIFQKDEATAESIGDITDKLPLREMSNLEPEVFERYLPHNRLN